MRKIYFLFFLMPFILVSCGMNYLTMWVTEPAPVTINPKITKVGIIDRSKASEETEKYDNIDKVLSAEGKNFDKEGSAKTVNGLIEQLNNNTRFTEVKMAETERIQNPGVGVFPAALTWDVVDQIAKENDVQVLFVLSFYDTDTHIEYKVVMKDVANPLGGTVPVPEHHCIVTTTIKTGWRIYDVADRVIADEVIFKDVVVSEGHGINPLSAAQAVMGRKEAVMQTSYQIGIGYATRVLPARVRVTREYYVKGSPKFKIGKRRAQVGDWDGAAELWLEETKNPKRKAAGRACYNMAIHCEINGDLEGAYEWTSKAYTDYKNKEALRYQQVIKFRMAQQRELEYQTDH
ncbi:MAG: hypothetical protein C0592_13035 [Marinilabiliales bacterium]|nr:MAG: hypothetical protein C0592_13035 [Marinilabiliales bacterium]